MTAVLVFLGGAIGAPLRYLTDRAVQQRHDTVFPWGTLTVNVVGSLLLGALTGGVLPEQVSALLGVGFCGALTTYSTFSYETLRLAEQEAYFYAAVNVVVSVLASVGAALLGLVAVQAALS
ncbi:MAG: fluoride efflux transporter CrcB [Saccharopolyspora sp.]|uniref:fluoride efflux transporter CrcB n=1 Tax=Saccharopolyspora TaxID=1835 RepID=UPI00190AF661|nr:MULTISPECIES: fluoride efflux transporter CrcB [unclassified Saccharopolyspora]MBK0866434.1 fluoride efflux transporter CrcB [Saccharopolyspora sp. HNM0986]MBQ6640419.1 fluoride efflux transporter CrcB [Saccharopolyspora sp.]